MKNPIVQIKDGEKIVMECTLRTLINQKIYEGNIHIAAKTPLKLFLNSEEVEPGEDMELQGVEAKYPC